MIKLALKVNSTGQDTQIEQEIQSRINRDDSCLYHAFTVARISEVPQTNTKIQILHNNGIKRDKILDQENFHPIEVINKKYVVSGQKYSKEFLNFLEE